MLQHTTDLSGRAGIGFRRFMNCRLKSIHYSCKTRTFFDQPDRHCASGLRMGGSSTCMRFCYGTPATSSSTGPFSRSDSTHQAQGYLNKGLKWLIVIKHRNTSRRRESTFAWEAQSRYPPSVRRSSPPNRIFQYVNNSTGQVSNVNTITDALDGLRLLPQFSGVTKRPHRRRHWCAKRSLGSPPAQFRLARVHEEDLYPGQYLGECVHHQIITLVDVSRSSVRLC